MLSPSGSIYVHIDVNMEHHVRLLMDDVFGSENFRNAITRIKCNPKNFDRYGYGNFKDTILFYSKSPGPITWHPQREPLTDDEIARLYPFIDEDGRRYTTNPLHAPGVTENGPTGQPWRGMPPPDGRHWRYPPDKLDELDAAGLIAWSKTGNPRKIRYASEAAGKLPQDVWLYKDPQRPRYPTQKERPHAGTHHPHLIKPWRHGPRLLRRQRYDTAAGRPSGPPVHRNGRRTGSQTADRSTIG